MNLQSTASRPAVLLSLFCLASLVSSPALPAEVSETGYPRLMQGPMIGAVSAHEIHIWARATGEYRVEIEYGTTFDLQSFQESEPVVARKANDFTVVVKLTGLEPDTEYFYRVKVAGEPDRYLKGFPPFRVKTAPIPGTDHDFRIAFGSCPRVQEDPVQPLWPVVSALEPTLFFWIGDNIYGDSLYPHVLQEDYRRQRDVPGLQPLLRSVPNLAIWDDHDYGLNNQDKGNPIKEEALAIFKQYWANPAYGLPGTPGIFFRYSYGRVDFFFLDGRYHRDSDNDPDTPEKTMLGRDQLAWLESELAASTAVFKVLVAGGGWSKAKGEGGDSWASFIHERNKIFNFIRDNEITGVILLSGDSHVGELNAIPWSDEGGYDFYDLVSSPLAQATPDSWLERRPEKRIRKVYFQGSNVGVVDFLFYPTPRLMYRLIDIHGRSVWEPFELQASELVNGVQSWPSKVSEEERFRQENYDQGNGYYEVPFPDD